MMFYPYSVFWIVVWVVAAIVVRYRLKKWRPIFWAAIGIGSIPLVISLLYYLMAVSLFIWPHSITTF